MREIRQIVKVKSEPNRSIKALFSKHQDVNDLIKDLGLTKPDAELLTS